MKPAAAAVVLILCGCAARQPPQADLSAVRAAEQALNYEPTANFERHGGRANYRICYWTGPFELPDDYTGLDYREGRCPSRSAGQDVLLYEPEALAGRETPVTGALAAADPQRRAFVTAHEDFHEQRGVRELEPALKEAYSTLAGLLTAAEAARIEHGDGSDEARAALAEAELFRRKSRIVNAAHARLRAVYARFDSGALSRREALAEKAAAFAELEAACTAVDPKPRAFAMCPAALNNAGLAFDATYTRRFDEAWALYEAAGRDAAATVARLRVAAAP